MLFRCDGKRFTSSPLSQAKWAINCGLRSSMAGSRPSGLRLTLPAFASIDFLIMGPRCSLEE